MPLFLWPVRSQYQDGTRIRKRFARAVQYLQNILVCRRGRSSAYPSVGCQLPCGPQAEIADTGFGSSQCGRCGFHKLDRALQLDRDGVFGRIGCDLPNENDIMYMEEMKNDKNY